MGIKRNGFTLIELLIVVAILGILVTIVVIAVNPGRIIRDTNDTKKRSELNQVKTALQLYFNDKNSYPATLDLLSPTYMRQDPTATGSGGFGYTTTFAQSGTDYAAGVALDNPSTDGDDQGTKTKCGTSITASSLDTTGLDYFVCPD